MFCGDEVPCAVKCLRVACLSRSVVTPSSVWDVILFSETFTLELKILLSWSIY